jgi:hypothetical protein
MDADDRSEYDDEVLPGIAASDERRHANDVKPSFNHKEI